MEINSVIEQGKDALAKVAGIVQDNPISTAALAGGVGVAAGVTAGVLGSAVVRKVKRKKSKSRRGRKRDHRYISKQKHERRRIRKRPGKIYKRKGLWLSRTKKYRARRKMTRRKGVHYTKNGQPYVLLRSGKARFIKRKGGRN